MLDAIVHNKVRGRLRELVYEGGKTKGSLHRDLHEDVITSTVFGPLHYMTTEQCWRNVRHVLLGGASEHPAGFELSAFNPDMHRLEFWPSLKSCTDSRVEPDLVIHFNEQSSSRALVVLLEVKWGSELSNEQLILQKQAAEDRYAKTKRAEIAQIFLAHVLNTERAREQIDATLCHAITWNQIAVRVWNPNAKEDIWTLHLKQLLNQLGIVPFTGFDHSELNADVDRDAVLGWTISPWRFDGFSSSVSIGDKALARIKQWRIAK